METYGSDNKEQEKYLVTDTKLLKETQAYPMMSASIAARPTTQVPDMLTGGQRNRRFAIVLAMGGLPGFEHMESPVMVSNDLPKVLLDGDNLETLRERAHAELDAMFNLFEDTVNGDLPASFMGDPPATKDDQ